MLHRYHVTHKDFDGSLTNEFCTLAEDDFFAIQEYYAALGPSFVILYGDEVSAVRIDA